MKKRMVVATAVFYGATAAVLMKKIANINAELRSVHERAEMMRQWIAAGEHGRSVYGYLKTCGYKAVVFICPKEWKNMLCRKNGQIDVRIIEQEDVNIKSAKQSVLPEDWNYDVVILVDPGHYREMSYEICEFADVPVLNLSDILTMMNKELDGDA